MYSPIHRLLSNTTDYRPAAVANLKEMNLPIVIYGAGEMALGIANVLETNDLVNSAYAVDVRYLGGRGISPGQADERFDRYVLVHGNSRGYSSIYQIACTGV